MASNYEDCFCSQCRGGSESLCERAWGKRPTTRRVATSSKSIKKKPFARPLGYACYMEQRASGLDHASAVTATEKHMQHKHSGYVADGKSLLAASSNTN